MNITNFPPSKPCTACGIDKALEDFHRQRHGRFGRHSWCKSCYNARHPKKKQLSSERRRELNLKVRYGLTLAEFGAMMESQGGACAVCDISLAGRKHHVDHDHVTGKVRGILCHRCNIHLPFAEDLDWIQKVHAYLGKGA